MSEWLSFVPPEVYQAFLIGLGLMVIASSICRIAMLDAKRDRLAYAAVLILLAVGAWFVAAGDKWGPVLVLLGVVLHQALTARFWVHDSPESTRKARP